MQPTQVCSKCGTPAVPGEVFCGECGQPVQPAYSAPSQVCYRCQAAVPPGQAFCDNCGQSLTAAPVPAQSPVQPPPMQPTLVAPKRSSLGNVFLIGCLGLVGVLLLAAGGVGFYVWRRASYTPPDRKPPQMAQRTAGVMKEFPVDTKAGTPAQPTSVTTQNLSQDGASRSGTTGSSLQGSLPPGVDTASLSRRGKTLTSATYNARPQSVPGSGALATGKDQVYVNVVDTMSDQSGSGDEIANSVTQATGGERTGVSVNSPTGGVYSGSRIRSAQVTVYVLEKGNANILIIIYSPDPSTAEVADRLAQNVGNGEGLDDYPEVKDALWTLPATLPNDMTLQEANTLTRGDLERTMASGSSSGGGGDEDMRRILEQMRQFIPERLISARYTDASRQEWNALEFDYGSGFQAWKTWMLARGLFGLGGSQSATVSGVDALYMDQDDKRILIFQKGPYFVILGGPSGAPVDKLIAFGNGFQL